MSDELQSDGTPTSEVEEQQNFDLGEENQANPNEGSELATETETTEQTPDSESAASNGAQEAINKQHKKYRDEERLRIDTQTQLAEAQRQLNEAQATQYAPAEVPPMPDQFDETFDQQVQDRDRIIHERAMFEAQQQNYAQQQQTQQQAAQQQRQQVLGEKVQAYVKQAEKFGISTQDLQAAGNLVGSYGISDDLQLHIVSDPDGPLITKFLAANPIEIDTIRNMDPYSAAMHIERNVRKQAVALKPKLSSTSDPSPNINGGGVDPKSGKYPMTGGATFT